MNIEMLSPDKLRVVLTGGDLTRYDLSYLSISSDDPATRRMVSDILVQARISTGFHFSNTKLLIEVVPGKNNGCVLYLTKSPGREKASAAAGKTRFDEGDPPDASDQTPPAYILSCGSLDDAIGAAGRFAGFPDVVLGRSALYNFERKYVLLFSPVFPGLDRKRLMTLLDELSEYGDTAAAGPVRVAMVKEHGQALSADHAVENMLRYFS